MGVVPTYDLLRDGVTQSLLLKYMSCKMRAYLYLHKLHIPGESREPLEFGNCIHYLLEHYYRGTNKATVEHWLLSEGYKVTDIPEKLQTLLHTAWALYSAYTPYWKKEDTAKQWVATESEFCVPFPVPGYGDIPLRGKRDGLYRGNRDRLWMLETKTTTSMNEEDKTLQLEFDFQSLFYLTATEIEMGEEVSGVYYNILKRPLYRQKKDETVEEFRQRVRGTIMEEPDNYFIRFECKFSAQRKRKFRQQLTALLVDYAAWVQGSSYGDVQLHKALPPIPQNTESCKTRFVCQFLSACAKDSTIGYEVKKNLFEELNYAGAKGKAASAKNRTSRSRSK